MIDKKSQRIVTFDLLRGIAILLMIYDHSLKSIQALHPTSADYYIAVILDHFVPLSSALFLFISGCLISYTFNKAEDTQAWLHGKIKRSLQLILLSYFLFIPLFFTQPENSHWLSTGILQTLGVLTFISALFLYLVSSRIIISLAVLNIILFTLNLINSIQPLPNLAFITAYGFPLLPHSGYFFAGLFFESIYNKVIAKRAHQFVWFSFILASIVLLISKQDPLSIFDELTIKLGHWQPTIELMVYVTLMMMAVKTILEKNDRRLAKINQIRPIIDLGRFALEVYVIHLVLLALLQQVYQAQTLIGYSVTTFLMMVAMISYGQFRYQMSHKISV